MFPEHLDSGVDILCWYWRSEVWIMLKQALPVHYRQIHVKKYLASVRGMEHCLRLVNKGNVEKVVGNGSRVFPATDIYELGTQ